MFVREQNKEGINFLLVKKRLRVFFNWFIVIYRDHIEQFPHVVLHIFFSIVDDFSRAVWIYLLVDKKEVSSMVKRFLAMV